MKRTAKRPRTTPKRSSRRISRAVSKPLKSRKEGVERPLASLRVVHSPGQVRAWLGLSLAELGREIARLARRPRAYDKAAVWHWEHGGVMVSEVREAYGVLIANKLTAQLGRNVGVKLMTNSPWTITAWTSCVICEAWFELRRHNQKRCTQCAGERKRR